MAIDIDQSHYNTGTATVAGTAVTGQGTTWLGAVRPGDLFGTHKGSGVRIASVNSNTSLTLAYAVTALNQTAAVYEIQRTPFDVGYYQALENLLLLLGGGNLPSLAVLNGTGGDKGVMFTGAGTAGTFGLTAFARTLLDDANAAGMRTSLELLPVQASVTDATADKLLRTGAFGLGQTVVLASPNLNDTRPSGRYYCNSPSNGPPGANGWLEVWDLAADFAYHEFTTVTTGAKFTRLKFSGAWLSGWQSETRVGVARIRVITASGTYTPDPNLIFADVTAIGSGGGGGAVQGAATAAASSAGGGSGTTSRRTLTKAQIGSSQPVTIAPGGAGGGSGPAAGSNGGTTSLGSLVTAPGGLGGGSSNAVSTSFGTGGDGGAAGTGDISARGSAGAPGSVTGSGVVLVTGGGNGAPSSLGGAGKGVYGATGGAGTAPGAGGGGTALLNSTGLWGGGAGANGVVIIIEYCEK